MKVGDLVRVNPDTLLDDDSTNRESLEKDGYLWRYERDISDTIKHGMLRAYTSLATGAGYDWYDCELVLGEQANA